MEVISTSESIRGVADAYGVGPETLRKWLIKYRDAHGGTETELTVTERTRLKELWAGEPGVACRDGIQKSHALWTRLLH